jgi:23S rRNA (guanosine2251-2'-O)-methyltransferase
VLVAAGSDRHPVVAEIVGLAGSRGVPVRTVSRGELETAARSETAQGVVALADRLPERSLADLLDEPSLPPFLVVLDGVTDPQNLGAVMRAALAAGATGVVLGRHRSARLTPVVAKAAAGAVEHLPVAAVPGIPAALAQLRSRGLWTVGLAVDGTGELWGLELATSPLALVLGSEGAGLSALSRRRCDVVLRIPMAGPLQSLNVAAAATLACFEVARLRRTEAG